MTKQPKFSQEILTKRFFSNSMFPDKPACLRLIVTYRRKRRRDINADETPLNKEAADKKIALPEHKEKYGWSGSCAYSSS
ncbi:MAG: hypothetical protein NWE99_10810 [Candidatus Bathyarchaeota archaeon]|nr:hypothetical protein [Candidatus Bathyarchaeota archaeon]